MSGSVKVGEQRNLQPDLVGEEMNAFGTGTRNRMENVGIHRTRCLVVDIGGELRGAVLDARFLLHSRSGTRKEASAHLQVGGAVQVTFQQEHRFAAVGGGKRCEHSGGARSGDQEIV